MHNAGKKPLPREKAGKTKKIAKCESTKSWGIANLRLMPI
jgi:hypothetical protein